MCVVLACVKLGWVVVGVGYQVLVPVCCDVLGVSEGGARFVGCCAFLCRGCVGVCVCACACACVRACVCVCVCV